MVKTQMVVNSLKFNKVDRNLIEEYAKRINLEFKDGNIGYFHLPKTGLDILDEVKEFIKNKEFDDLVIVGMGGSSLGTKAVCKLLGNKKIKINV